MFVNVHGYQEGRCMICGAPISPNNLTGIGCECQKVLERIQFETMFANEEFRTHYFQIESKPLINMLREYWNSKGARVRSSFKKSFIPSVLDFYDGKGFVSRKQLNLVIDILKYECSYLPEILNRIEKEKKDYLNSMRTKVEITDAMIATARARIRGK